MADRPDHDQDQGQPPDWVRAAEMGEDELAPPPGFLSPPQLPGPAAPDLPGESISGGDGPGPGSSGTQGRSTPGLGFKGLAGALRKVADKAVIAAGGLINRMVAVDEQDESFLPDEDDRRMIAPPLGRLAARHLPLDPDRLDSSDVEDIATLAIGLISYLIQGVADAVAARRERARVIPGTVVHRDDQAAGQ